MEEMILKSRKVMCTEKDKDITKIIRIGYVKRRMKR